MSDTSDNSNSNLQSALDSLKSKGVHVLLVDGKIKLRGNVDRNIKPELRTLNANRETLCLLLEIESTTCESAGETTGEEKEETDKDDKDKSPKLDLGITPAMSSSQVEERIRQYNDKVRQEREELAAKRRDRSLIEVSLGVFRNREEWEREQRTYTFELPSSKNGMQVIAANGQVNYGAQSIYESQLDRFREWTESRWKERE